VSSKDRRPESAELPSGSELSDDRRSDSLPVEPRDFERPRQWDSETLLAGLDEAWIIHGDETYRLRRTRNGKLILVK
jgi:hemin uptake protein HemP